MSNRSVLIFGGGCLLLALILLVVIPLLFLTPITRSLQWELFQPEPQVVEQPVDPAAQATQEAIPTFTPAAPVLEEEPAAPGEPVQVAPGVEVASLTALYGKVNPGVVNIQVYITRGPAAGQGAGSGFIVDEQGHIITNHHVIAGAQQVSVIFFNGIEAYADVVGTDPDSDLAVIRVARLPEDTHPLPLGDSDAVQVGEWVIAIGNPFGQQSSMTMGIVSAVDRTIPSGFAQFNIPQAIQTDAAINPGNSGGPLMNLAGEVIGVNAQIATAGAAASAGVGFAIPANVVRRVAPVLIEQGAYQWPWMGISGESVNLAIMQANNLETQHGAYVHNIVSGSPAAQAGLRGSRTTETINGLPVPVGGDVIVEINEQLVANFDQLLATISFYNPGEQLMLTVIRDGQRQQIPVTLGARPRNAQP